MFFVHCQAKNLSDCWTIRTFHDFPRKIKEILLKIFQNKIVLNPGSKIELISSVIWITSDQVTMITNEAKILHFSRHTFKNIWDFVFQLALFRDSAPPTEPEGSY